MRYIRPVTRLEEKKEDYFSYDNLEFETKKQLEKESNYDRLCIGDTTKYGEFVSSYFAWITLDKQKKKAEEMQKMGKKL